MKIPAHHDFDDMIEDIGERAPGLVGFTRTTLRTEGTHAQALAPQVGDELTLWQGGATVGNASTTGSGRQGSSSNWASMAEGRKRGQARTRTSVTMPHLSVSMRVKRADNCIRVTETPAISMADARSSKPMLKSSTGVAPDVRACVARTFRTASHPACNLFKTALTCSFSGVFCVSE